MLIDWTRPLALDNSSSWRDLPLCKAYATDRTMDPLLL